MAPKHKYLSNYRVPEAAVDAGAESLERGGRNGSDQRVPRRDRMWAGLGTLVSLAME